MQALVRAKPNIGKLAAVTVDPLVLIAEIDRATARLLETAQALDDGAVGEPSLLPGWTRGHVLAHVARNADGCTNLLTWARTGVETPQYPSGESREADIVAAAGRPIGEHLADLEASAARFSDAVDEMPLEAWGATVRWLSGRADRATGVTWSRLREVEVHHVDLGLSYVPSSWPAAFVHRLLHEVAVGFSADPKAPAMRLHAEDLGHELAIGSTADAVLVSGPGHALAAWLTGRSRGVGLTVVPDGPLPEVPTWK
jgi:maleylpyruvate isomerase